MKPRAARLIGSMMMVVAVGGVLSGATVEYQTPILFVTSDHLNWTSAGQPMLPQFDDQNMRLKLLGVKTQFSLLSTVDCTLSNLTEDFIVGVVRVHVEGELNPQPGPTGGYGGSSGIGLQLKPLGSVHTKAPSVNFTNTPMGSIVTPYVGTGLLPVLHQLQATVTSVDPEHVAISYLGGELIGRYTIKYEYRCRADVAPASGGDHDVNIDDLVALIGAWGGCILHEPCPMDISPQHGDGKIDIDDLVVLITSWGACPD